MKDSTSLPRILFISHTAEWTGPTNSLLLLLTRLRNRFRVAVLLPGDGDFVGSLEDAGIPVFRFPSLSKLQIPAMVRLIKREGFDLVYGNNTSSGSLNALIAAKIAGVPYVAHVRGMSKNRSPRRLALLRFADSTIAVSRAAAESVSRFLGGSEPHVVYNGVPLSRQPSIDRTVARRHVSTEFGIRDDVPVIISVSHVCWRKGQKHAVSALRLVSEKLPGVHLVLVGSLDRDPVYVEELRRLISNVNLQERVRLVGFRGDVERLLLGSNIFLHTAVADPHPRAVLEAMAAELPVVAFDVDGVAETVAEGETGYLVPIGDVEAMAGALLRLALDQFARARLGSAGRSRVVAHFSADRTARRVADILETTLKKRRAAARSRARAPAIPA